MTDPKAELHKAGLINRVLGQQEFRIAAMRYLERMNLTAAAISIGRMEVDQWLTPEEIANREKMP
jgi:hypothetical protein